MKTYIIAACLILSSFTLLAQNNDIWFSFLNADSTLVGFKDKNDHVKIKPKFVMTMAGRFDNIIAVSEDAKGKSKSYYLTKSGKIVGKDSMYVFDNGYDCENEGFIRFHSPKTDKVGMFNKDGKIVVPAKYNELSKVYNGLILALKGAKKEYWDKSHKSGCEHYSWTGGKSMLIDTSNKVLINNFLFLDHNLNFYSLQITKKPHPDTTRISFLADDGSYYSFIDFQREFKQWLYTNLKDLTIDKFFNISYDSIDYSYHNHGHIKPKEEIITKNFEQIKNGLLEIFDPKTKFSIFIGDDYTFLKDNIKFQNYYNNCGELKEWLFPTATIVVTHQNNGESTQNHFNFLRTDKGYILYGITLRN